MKITIDPKPKFKVGGLVCLKSVFETLRSQFFIDGQLQQDAPVFQVMSITYSFYEKDERDNFCQIDYFVRCWSTFKIYRLEEHELVYALPESEEVNPGVTTAPEAVLNRPLPTVKQTLETLERQDSSAYWDLGNALQALLNSREEAIKAQNYTLAAQVRNVMDQLIRTSVTYANPDSEDLVVRTNWDE